MAATFCLLLLSSLVAGIVAHQHHLPDGNDLSREELLEDIEELVLEMKDVVDQKKPKESSWTEKDAEDFARWFNAEASKRANREAKLGWNSITDITDENSKKYLDDSVKFSTWSKEQAHRADEFLKNAHIENSDTKRQLMIIARTADPKSDKKLKELDDIGNKLSNIYGKAKLCDEATKKCYTGEPDLEDVMAKSRDYDRLLWAWRGWRHVTGPPMRPLYTKFVELMNVGASDNGYKNIGEYWSQSMYEQSNSEVEAMVDQLWEEVRPMYVQLHAYIRRKLKAKYPKANIQDGGYIPAHLLGNMWSQQWNNIFDIVVPHPAAPTVDVTKEMQAQGYTPLKMFKTAESFFTSIGLPPMTKEFWERSVIEKPEGKDMQCHGSASDFSDGKDFRIKMCTRVTMSELGTIHHEMGHVEYYMAYKDQPYVYQGGANSAFHEAIGDTISLSVLTPEHFTKLKLLKEQSKVSEEQKKKTDINFLMLQALYKVAFLPFGLMIDKWRWRVFKGEIDETNYNSKWWELRKQYQGIEPPIARSEEDFDPGAKYHIPSNTPYIRYFMSFLVQFQFHASLCDAAGYKGPLHHCDIYKSKDAGAKLQSMLKLGSSKHWQDALYTLTGQRKIDTSKIKQYFQPLTDWLKEQNKGEVVGWGSQKPDLTKRHMYM